MPAKDSPDVLVARYLRDHGYEATFHAFLKDVNLEASSISSDPAGLTIEKVLDEKRLYDLAVAFEKTDVSDDKPFTEPCPIVPYEIPSDARSNVLFVALAELSLTIDRDDGSSEPQNRSCIIATTADKHMRIFSAEENFKLLRDFDNLHVAPILSVVPIDNKRLLSSSMSGEVVLSDAHTGQVLDRRKDHSKYAVKLVLWKDEGSGIAYAATAGYDKKVAVYSLSLSPSGESASTVELVGTLDFQATVEEVLFTEDYRTTIDGNPQVNSGSNSSMVPLLAVTVRDSPYLQYHTIHNNELRFSHRYGLSLNSTSWALFSAMTVLPNPVNPRILAVATSTVPEMKLVLLDQTNGDILKEVFTSAPHGAYSNAVLCWRPDGSGLWINADDGIVRGVSSRTGETVKELKKHSNKVRTLWAGHIEGRGEVLISGSFDTKLVLWGLDS